MANHKHKAPNTKAYLVVAFALAVSLTGGGTPMGTEMLQVARRLCRQLSVLSDLAQQSNFVVCVERSQPAMGGEIGLS